MEPKEKKKKLDTLLLHAVKNKCSVTYALSKIATKRISIKFAAPQKSIC